MASASVAQKVRELEMIIAIDPDTPRGGLSMDEGTMVLAYLAKYYTSRCHSIMVTNGYFPKKLLKSQNEFPKRGTRVDGSTLCLYFQGVLKRQIPILTYQGGSAEAAQAFLCRDRNPKSPRFDHLVAIERTGGAAEGNYYNARKRNAKHLVDAINGLFPAVQKIPGISSAGVGDGGNELGMGKVKEAVKRHIRNGDVIACDVETDFAVIIA
ncbi:hypothetical protein EI555_020775, partial [Monodon monoceros]